MAIGVFTVLAVFAVVWVLAYGPQFQIETRPFCDRCASSTHLIREEWTNLGLGWLEARRTYRCPSCAVVLQRNALSGPVDLLN